ncbi:MAG: hypothetical protein H7Y38_12120 [Armatimonadetes bacterium]|nr:hypothetical protein [Armatimonadota bacterium]
MILSNRLSIALAIVLLVAATAQSPAQAQGKKPTAKSAKRAPVTGGVVTLTDPVEKAFTAKTPAGWRSQAYLARVYELYRPVVTSLSPDSKTVLFYGDPRQQGFTVPTQYMNENSGLPQNPLMGWSEYIPADDYFTEYVRKKFGKMPGFRLIGAKPNPALQRYSEESAQKSGRNQTTTTTLVYFDYTDKGKPMHGVVSGATLGIQTVWITDVAGVATSGNPNDYLPAIEKMRKSVTFSKSWVAQQQQRHEARMAQLRQDHANQLASWNASNRQHDLRMQAISDAGDASMKKWYAQQAQSDNTQRRFLNYITEENTVVTGGKTYQVDNSHQRYFVNKNTGKYIGTSSTTDLNDLRRVANVNPDDYEEAKIKP